MNDKINKNEEVGILLVGYIESLTDKDWSNKDVLQCIENDNNTSKELKEELKTAFLTLRKKSFVQSVVDTFDD